MSRHGYLSNMPFHIENPRNKDHVLHQDNIGKYDNIMREPVAFVDFNKGKIKAGQKNNKQDKRIITQHKTITRLCKAIVIFMNTLQQIVFKDDKNKIQDFTIELYIKSKKELVNIFIRYLTENFISIKYNSIDNELISQIVSLKYCLSQNTNNTNNLGMVIETNSEFGINLRTFIQIVIQPEKFKYDLKYEFKTSDLYNKYMINSFISYNDVSIPYFGSNLAIKTSIIKDLIIKSDNIIGLR